MRKPEKITIDFVLFQHDTDTNYRHKDIGYRHAFEITRTDGTRCIVHLHGSGNKPDEPKDLNPGDTSLMSDDALAVDYEATELPPRA